MTEVTHDSLAHRACARARRARDRVSLARYRWSRPTPRELFSTDRGRFGPELARAVAGADVINLHWVAGLLDWSGFFRALPSDARLVWTLHDLNPFTGGCHYDRGCGRFQAGCGACPALGSRGVRDASRSSARRKVAALARLGDEQLVVVAPSRWLADEARRSLVLGRFRAEVIPYGVDTNRFTPAGRAEARAALGLGANERVALFVADDVTDPRKGLVHVERALASIGGVRLVLVGGGTPPPGPSRLALGKLADERRLALAYSAADVLVVASREDNLPNTVLESLACGTPVVGFAVGGVPDLVREGETGYLVPSGDDAALSTAIARVVADPSLRDGLSRRCRAVAEAELALAVQARRYAALYRALAAQRPSAAR